MACMPGEGAKKANKDEKQKEYCMVKTETKKNVVYKPAVVKTEAQCMNTDGDKKAEEANCGKVASCTLIGGKTGKCIKKGGSCRDSADTKKAHSTDATTCLEGCKDKAGKPVDKCTFFKTAAADVAEAKEDWKCACIAGAQRLAIGAALIASAYVSF